MPSGGDGGGRERGRRGVSGMAAVGRDEGAGEAAMKRTECRAGERGAPPRRDEGAAEQHASDGHSTLQM